MKIFFAKVPSDLQKVIKAVYITAIERLSQSLDCEMSLSFVSEEEIKRLNAEFRQIDSVTDVLSFPAIENVGREMLKSEEHTADVDPVTGNLMLGDVIVCVSRAKEQAESYGHSLKRELCFLALHGLLHLYGYDHTEENDEKQMNAIAEEILSAAGVTRE